MKGKPRQVGVVLPALLGGRWLEGPVGHGVAAVGDRQGGDHQTEALLSVLAARWGKGGALQAATARAVYLSLLDRGGEESGEESGEDAAVENGEDVATESNEEGLKGVKVALAKRLLGEMRAAEIVAGGVSSFNWTGPSGA